MDYLLSFHSTHKALKAESILKAQGVEFRLLPAPKEIAAYCALVISIKDRPDTLVELLKGSGGEAAAVFKKEKDGYVKV
ncbi:MAG: DUF3343 domain-containing protein [Proteobacteria bacterium]|nr:DUF3343 domain-containing protein [Pseudomonadota bacterium]